MRALVAVLLCLLVLRASPATASGLYEASVLVTGMDLRSRPEGLTRALRQVLTKVSGNPAWLDDGRVAGITTESALSAFAYLDRESDIPKHDEQGTRDRPYNLIARFDPAKIDAILRRLGDAPWSAIRPTVVVDVTITTRKGDVLPMRADTDADERHRAALLAASDRFGLEVFLPGIIAPVDAPAASPRLVGRLQWSEPDFGWNGDWHLQWQGADSQWRETGQSFDEVYRDALANACKILSGH